MLKNKNILLGVSGGIAAYKAVDVASKLKKAGANVKVILTKNAEKFITPLAFHSITGNPVHKTMFEDTDYIQHIELAEWADIIVVGPATSNIIGKVAGGIADDLLSSTIIAKDSPVLFIPAMNSRMLNNPIVKENVDKLEHYGYKFLESESGLMACGTIGAGRFPRTPEILYAIESALEFGNDFEGKKILISTGGTKEHLDPMRCLSNVSSGKMGADIARATALRGAKVTLVSANVSVELPHYVNNVKVVSAKEMFEYFEHEFSKYDIIIMASAVADYCPKEFSNNKIKKSENMCLELIRTTDILNYLGENKTKEQKLIGFAAETQNVLENAKKKLVKKNLDLIVANDLSVAGKNDTEAYFLAEKITQPVKGTKFEVANKLLDMINTL